MPGSNAPERGHQPRCSCASDAVQRVFAAGGETGRLMMTMDWSRTALGPVRDWGPSLLLAIGICLESRFPLEVLWGPDFIEIHNDALMPMIGSKHPGCLGRPYREIFPETASRTVPMLEEVMSGGGSTWAKDWPSRMYRRGFLEDCYFTFSFSPIRELPEGNIAGVFVAVQETTEQVLDRRRIRCLHELTRATASPSAQEQVFRRTVEVLGRFASDIPYCILFLQPPVTPRSTVPQTPTLTVSTGLTDPAKATCRSTTPPCGLLELEDLVAAGRSRIVDGLLPRLALRQSDGSPPSSSAMVVPLRQRAPGFPAGLLVFGTSDWLPSDVSYRDFLGLVADQIAAAIVVAQSAERERALAADIRHRAYHDSLTELPNRTALFEQIEHAIAEARNGPARAGLLFVDLDGFKTVNDTLGHLAGDELLRKVAGLLRGAVRPGDVVARLAGDEFGILCRDLASAGAADVVADRVVDSLNLQVGHGQIQITASVGIAMIGPTTASAEQLICAADTAMYAAKRREDRQRGYWQRATAQP